MSPRNEKIERIACYIRVSSQEQKLHGLSLDAQRDTLKRYAEKHNLKIVDWYEDEGVSGRKIIRKRPELQRMLNDAKAGKFDRIIFIKLDRFFRSVAEYHECMKMIEPVVWTATEEKYDLTSASGRAFVNMKLTIAELEADTTGERIKIVNEYKVRTGQALTSARIQGIAFTVVKTPEGKKVVKDPETQDMIMDYLNHFIIHQNKRSAYLYVKEKYNCNIEYRVFDNVLSNTKLYGHYRGNDNYCEPYIDKATFDKIQEINKTRNIRKRKTNRTYLFSGLIRCPECNRLMAGTHNNVQRVYSGAKAYTYNREYFTYRCIKHSASGMCSFNKRINETKVEDHLLSNIDKYITCHLTEISVLDAEIRDSHVGKKIKNTKAEMDRVKKMYRKGDITEDEYDNDMDELRATLKELESQLEPVKDRDLTIYQDLLKSDWKELYNALTKENKRSFWRKYIDHIELNLDGTVKEVIFF